MDRRNFILKTGLSAAGLLALPHNLDANDFDVNTLSEESSENNNILIIIELCGGNDGLNTIIPIDSSSYYALRPNIAVKPEETVGALNIYLNSALVDGVYNEGFKYLLEVGRLAVIQGVGLPEDEFSHQYARKISHSCRLDSNALDSSVEGWLGRFLAFRQPDYPNTLPEHPIAIVLDDKMPLLLKTNKAPMGITLADINTFHQTGSSLVQRVDKIDSDNRFAKQFNLIHSVAEQNKFYSELIKNAYDNGIKKISQSVFSTGISLKMKTIAALIAGGLNTQVYYLKLQNFDTHSAQNGYGISKQHNKLLSELARAISEFSYIANQLEFLPRVLAVTMSEFGRRTIENSSLGTDHGNSSVQFVFGHSNYVNASQWGNDPDLSDLDKHLNPKLQFDFRNVYSDILKKWFSARVWELNQLFGSAFNDIGFLNARNLSIDETIKQINGNALSVFPNPTSGAGKVSFILNKSNHIDIEIFDLKGASYSKIFIGFLNEGAHSINFHIAQSGVYIIQLKINSFSYVEKIIVN